MALITRKTNRTPKLETSMIPLINVVFLLLIFFLITGTVQTHQPFAGILPQTDSGEPLEAEKPLILALGREQELTLNGQRVAPALLHKVLLLHLAIVPERPVVLSLHRDLPGRHIAALLEVLEKAGAKNVLIQSQVQKE